MGESSQNCGTIRCPHQAEIPGDCSLTTEFDLEDNEDGLFEHHRIVADAGQSLLRIDKFLMDRLPNVTRSKIQNGIHDGFVAENNKAIKPQLNVIRMDCDAGMLEIINYSR